MTDNTIKYYTRSNGEKVDITTMDNTHLWNSYAKLSQELLKDGYEKTPITMEDFIRRSEAIGMLRDEIARRHNDYRETLNGTE